MSQDFILNQDDSGQYMPNQRPKESQVKRVLIVIGIVYSLSAVASATKGDFTGVYFMLGVVAVVLLVRRKRTLDSLKPKAPPATPADPIETAWIAVGSLKQLDNDSAEAARIAAADDKRQRATLRSDPRLSIDLHARQPEVLIKTYKSPQEFNRDAKKMLRDGWTITNQSQLGSHDGLGRKAVKFALFWPALFLKGADKIMVTWSR
jgi:hypothetical protein